MKIAKYKCSKQSKEFDTSGKSFKTTMRRAVGLEGC